MKAATAVRTATRFRNILFATDYSAVSALAIPFVKNIAKHYDARITALHVKAPIATPMVPPPSWPTNFEAMRELDQEHREELLDTFKGIEAQVLIEEGSILEQLQKAIEKNDIDLVVIGTRGRTGLGKMLLGSVAEDIFRTVQCAVLTVGPHSDAVHGALGEFREILFATDFTSESHAAAAYAISLAQEFQAKLVLLHVIPKEEAGDLVSASEIGWAAKELLHKLVPADAEAWCKPEYLVERGIPAEKILEIARMRDSDLIVLGVKPETGIPGASTHLPIATAHKIVAQANCPVLTVRS